MSARVVASIALIGAGVIALAWSFATPLIDDGRSSWTTEKAEQYAEASQRLHRLSATPPRPGEGDQYAEATVDYRSLQAELEYARGRRGRVAWGLRGAGLAMMIVGVVVGRRE